MPPNFFSCFYEKVSSPENPSASILLVQIFPSLSVLIALRLKWPSAKLPDRTHLWGLLGISTGLALNLGGNSVIRTHCIFNFGGFIILEVTELGASGK